MTILSILFGKVWQLFQTFLHCRITKYQYIIDKKEYICTSYETDQKTRKDSVFCLFLKLVQINYTLFDNVNTFVYCKYINYDIQQRQYNIVVSNSKGSTILVRINRVFEQAGRIQLTIKMNDHILTQGPGGSMSQVVGLPNNSFKPITNTACVRARLCKLQKGCTRLASASDKVYQLLAHGRWFFPGTPASPTTKTGRHDIAEILLSGVKHQKSINQSTK